MSMDEARRRILTIVADIPPGRVMTYGDVAACCGYPGAARLVGVIAHEGDDSVPWHRVVGAGGRLATQSDASPNWQSEALQHEAVVVLSGRIQDFESVSWYPDVA